MGRLIDADLLLKSATKYSIGRKSFEEMIKCVNEQPTAFDAEAVVQQLKELICVFIEMRYTEEYCKKIGYEKCKKLSCNECILSRAIDIVIGGVNHDQ